MKTVTYNYLKKIGPERVAREYLFPLMEREAGLTFCMNYWNLNLAELIAKDKIVNINEVVNLDNIKNRAMPKCNTVQCIGGGLQAIIKPSSVPGEFFENYLGRAVVNQEGLGGLLGLDPAQSYGLFRRWIERSVYGSFQGYGWPDALSKAYLKAKTPIGKVRVAQRCILRAIKTKGKCLEPPKDFCPNLPRSRN